MQPNDAASSLSGMRFVSVEFIYKPRPQEINTRKVFDFALRTRLNELSLYQDAAVLYLCVDHSSWVSLQDVISDYSHLPTQYAIVNTTFSDKPLGTLDAQLPYSAGWHDPENWRQMVCTDRWARICYALEMAAHFTHSGYLLLPAHDAVWGNGLIGRLVSESKKYITNGVPAAVSPYTPHQHSAIPDLQIPLWVIETINAAFGRDFWLFWRLTRGNFQNFWGKMGIIPYAMCNEILRRADVRIWEDDLEIDRVIREAGYSARTLWVHNPQLYRQTLPVFDLTGIRDVMDRTLHYSLNLPSATLGSTSILTRELGLPLQIKRLLNQKYSRAITIADRITQECLENAAARIQQTGISWVDWGRYRHVVRVGDPFVQVWNHNVRL